MTTNEQVFADKNNKTIKMNSLKIKDTEQLTIVQYAYESIMYVGQSVCPSIPSTCTCHTSATFHF